MSVPSSSDSGLRFTICQVGITVSPIHENANVPKIPRKRGVSPFISGLRMSQLNRIEKCWDSRCAAQSQKHETEVISENKMRYGQQNAGKAASAKIWQRCFNAFAEWQRRVFKIPALKKTAGEQHKRHQSDAIG